MTFLTGNKVERPILGDPRNWKKTAAVDADVAAVVNLDGL
jgi:hypothetical protein